MPEKKQQPAEATPEPAIEEKSSSAEAETRVAEYGGPKGREPTRYGDWEKNGRCIDF